MKKLILSIILSLFVSVSAYGAVGDITSGVDETRADVAKWTLDNVTFLVFTKTIKVTYQKLDASDNRVNGSKQILFKDVVDDPETPEDETLTEFTDVIAAIDAGSNIKNTISAAVKLKLGLP